jgi:hypothetical protein
MSKIHNNIIFKERRVELRRSETPTEKKLWWYLRNNKMGEKFKRQHSIGGYITDFYCADKRLIVELDGEIHNNKHMQNTPQKIQDFLDKIPFNFEEKGETYWPPSKMLRENKAHCFEGAVFACFCLQKEGIPNYLMDLKVKNLRKDSDHTLCIFKINNFWGAISKTNHAVLRFRDPIYKNYRELALSYYHEYFLDSGEKTLQSFSKPFPIWKKFGNLIEGEKDLDEIALALDKSPHIDFAPGVNAKFIRNAGKTEIKGAAVTEWRDGTKKKK